MHKSMDPICQYRRGEVNQKSSFKGMSRGRRSIYTAAILRAEAALVKLAQKRSLLNHLVVSKKGLILHGNTLQAVRTDWQTDGRGTKKCRANEKAAGA